MNVKQYSSKGEFVRVVMKDEKEYSNVIICPDPYDPYSKRHILEWNNGDTLFVYTSDIKGVYFIK